MILYHGSYCEIETIDIRNCHKHTDFGCGFYLTPFEEHAMSRALQKAAETGMQPVVNRFVFNEKLLTSGKFKVKMFSDNSEGWAEFILMNRENADFTHDYDIVVGPIADDAMRKQFFRYRAGLISMSELSSNLEYKEESVQFCFCSQRAIKTLKKI